MSKVDELKKEFSHIDPRTFKRFVESDTTKTHKYLRYLLTIWSEKPDTNNVTLINLVKNFNELLPYIENKDIYSKEYEGLDGLNTLVDVVNHALEFKKLKTFDKTENIIIIKETDEYMMIYPKTHKASVKYGYNTKWCTSSKDDDERFNEYQNGSLIYVISKKPRAGSHSEKLGLTGRHDFDQNDINSGYDIFDAEDDEVTFSNLMSCGWTIETLVDMHKAYTTFVANTFPIVIYERKLTEVLDELDLYDIETDSLNTHINDLKNDEPTQSFVSPCARPPRS